MSIVDSTNFLQNSDNILTPDINQLVSVSENEIQNTIDNTKRLYQSPELLKNLIVNDVNLLLNESENENKNNKKSHKTEIENLKNIHNDEQLLELFGNDFNLNNLDADLEDTLKMKMVPILKLDSSRNTKQQQHQQNFDYDEEHSASSFPQLNQRANSYQFNINHLDDTGTFSAETLNELFNGNNANSGNTPDFIETIEEDGRKFWLVNGRYYDSLPKFNNNLELPNPQMIESISKSKNSSPTSLDQNISSRQESSSNQNMEKSPEKLSSMEMDSMNQDFHTMHFPTCYNNLETKTATCNKPVIIILAIILALICIASISGNFLVLLVIAKSSRLRKPPSVFKVSLAIADLLLSLFVIPSLLYNLFTTILVPEDPIYTLAGNITDLQKIPNWIPRTVGSAQLISMTASILTLLVMSVDRLVAIRWPIYHRIHNSCNRATCSILVIWIISLIPTIIMNISKNIKWHLEVHTMTYGPTFYSNVEDDIYNPLPLQSRVFGISYCVIYWVFPWILTTFLTIGVGFYGWKSLKSLKTIPKQRIKPRNSDGSNQTDNSTARIIVPIHEDSSTDTQVSNVTSSSDKELIPSGSVKKHEVHRHIIRRTENKNEDSSKRLVKTLTILVIMYTVCTLPLTILQLCMWINDGTSRVGSDSFRWLWFIASFLYLFQSAMNIFIYHRSKEFSEALKNLYGRKRTSIYNQTDSYRNTLRTNIQSKARVFKQHTLTTSDGGNKISMIADSPGINNLYANNRIPPLGADIFNNNNAILHPSTGTIINNKGELISKLDTKTISQRNAERLAVFNMDLENDEVFRPPLKEMDEFENLNFEKIVPGEILGQQIQQEVSKHSRDNGHSQCINQSNGINNKACVAEDSVSLDSADSGSGHGNVQ